MAGCRSYAGQTANDAPPYLYYETLANGTRAIAAPLLDEASGHLAALRRVVCDGYVADEEARPPSGIHDGLNLLGVYLGICVTVFVSIAMASSTQLALPVSERNSMLAALAFLTPVIEVLLAPGSAETLQRNPSCGLLPTATDVVTTARGLWLLTSWSWPLQFCSMVLSGLLMGAREFALYGMATILSQGALAGIWFMGGVQDLHLLGWATFISQLVLCLSLALCLAFHVPLRRKMGLLLPEGMRDMTEALEPSERRSGASMSKEVLLDGVLAMVLDLALQFAGTVSVYVAAYVSLQDL
eukprot:Skav221470  [mRNA]  locus=scaffold1700:435987:440521:+ [translate_table: standard]